MADAMARLQASGAEPDRAQASAAALRNAVVQHATDHPAALEALEIIMPQTSKRWQSSMKLTSRLLEKATLLRFLC